MADGNVYFNYDAWKGGIPGYFAKNRLEPYFDFHMASTTTAASPYDFYWLNYDGERPLPLCNVNNWEDSACLRDRSDFSRKITINLYDPLISELMFLGSADYIPEPDRVCNKTRCGSMGSAIGMHVKVIRENGQYRVRPGEFVLDKAIVRFGFANEVPNRTVFRQAW